MNFLNNHSFSLISNFKSTAKKSITTIISIIFATLICTSCSSNRQAVSEHIYQAIIDEIKDTIQFQDIVESYSIIPLENITGCRIGEISDLIITDSLMYVISDGIYCFNKAGTHQFTINKKGHAQDEYSQITSVNIADGNIYVYDVMQGKILTFNCKNGTYLRRATMPNPVARLFCTDKKSVADQSDLANTTIPNDERFFVFSTNHPENVSNAFLAENKNKLPIQGQTTMHDSGFFFSNYWRCKTWKMNKNDCQPYFQLTFSSDYSLNTNEIKSLIASKQLSSDLLNKAKKAWGLTNIHETNCNITGDFRVGTSLASFIFNRNTNKCVAYKNVKNEGSWQPAPMCFMTESHEQVYKIILAEDITLVRTINGNTTLPKQSVNKSNPHDIYCSITENDNPVIVEYTLK